MRSLEAASLSNVPSSQINTDIKCDSYRFNKFAPDLKEETSAQLPDVRLRCLTPVRRHRLHRLTENWNCYSFPNLCSLLLFEIICTFDTCSSFSPAAGLLVDIINTLSIGNLFHTLFLSLPLLPKVESSCNKYGVREPGPAGGEGGEREEITRAACRILKIHYLKLT